MRVSCSTREKRHRNATNESKAVCVETVAAERESRERRGMFSWPKIPPTDTLWEVRQTEDSRIKETNIYLSNNRKMLSTSPEI